MSPTDQHARHSTPRSGAADGERLVVPAWPTRDLERLPARAEMRSASATDNAPMEPIAPEATSPLVAEDAAEATGTTDMTETMTETLAEPTTEPAPAPMPQSMAAPAMPMSPAADRTSARRPTTFLADLTRAMRVAAEEERANVQQRFREEADAYVGSMRIEFAAAADLARERAEADVVAIETWCEAELARIRKETEDGIAQRRARLDEELTSQSARLDEGVTHVAGSVESFEQQMTAFFERLLVEEDPSTFAVMARQLPEPPVLDAWPDPGATRASDGTTDWPAADGGPAPWDPGSDAVLTDPEALAAAEAEAAEALAAEGFGTAANAPVAATADPSGRMRMTVGAVGLISVASVSAFKRMLSRVDGIHAVQVSSGPQGEFVFSLTCDAGMDLAAAVCALPGFDVELRSTAEDGITVVARDLEPDNQ